MAIQWSCSCGQELLADDQHAGRKVRCPICKRIMGIPGSRQPATGAVVARRMRDEDEAEDDDRPRRGEGLSNRDRLARARIGLGLHWGKTLCFLIIFAFALLACLVFLIATISVSAGRRGGGGDTPAFVAVLGVLFTCIVGIALFVMPLLGAIGSLMGFWLPERSGGRVLSMVACGLDSAAFLFLLGAMLMYISAVGGAVGRMGATAPGDILKASVMMTALVLLSYLLMLAGWILHMLVLKNLAAYARDRGTAGDAVRMLIVGLVTFLVPGILISILIPTLGPRAGLAGELIIEFLLIIWTGSLLAVAFKLLNLTSTVRHLL
jgi:hypothetical protein